MTGTGIAQSAAALRREFDERFAEAIRLDPPGVERFVAITVASEPYVVRLAEIDGLHADATITPLPSPMPTLVGVTAVRGRLLAVHDLGMLLGYPPTPSPRWVLTVRDAALAFASLDGHWVVPREFVSPDVVRNDGATRTIVQIASVMDDIRQRVAAIRNSKER